MRVTSNWAVGTGRPFLIFLALLLGVSAPSYAQKYYRVDVESKVLHKGTVKVMDKEIYYSRGGNLNILWSQGPQTFYSTSSRFGFTTCYYPSTNQSVTLDPNMFNPVDELLYVFAEGGIEDMGLSRQGFILKTTKKDGDFIVRRFEPRASGSMCAWVEIAYDTDFRPVYCAYFNKKGKAITKTYLSNYKTEKGFTFPMRVTEISYMMEKKDSTVKLDLYKNLEIDVQRDLHVFQVPSDAVPTDLKDNLKNYIKTK